VKEEEVENNGIIDVARFNVLTVVTSKDAFV
jgi:hypothetical protein